MTKKEILEDIADFEALLKDSSVPQDEKDFAKDEIATLKIALTAFDKPKPAAKKKAKVATPARKVTAKKVDPDCDDLLDAYKKRKANQKKASAKSDKSSTAAKDKKQVEKSASRVKKHFKDGELSLDQIKALIAEYKEAIAELETLLKGGKKPKAVGSTYEEERKRQLEAGDIDDDTEGISLLSMSKAASKKKVVSKSEPKHRAYVDFMNKDKGYATDRKYFTGTDDWDAIQKATKWAKNEFEKFHPDMVTLEHGCGGEVMEGGGEVEDVTGWSNSELAYYLGIPEQDVIDSREDSEYQANELMRAANEEDFNAGGSLKKKATSTGWKHKMSGGGKTVEYDTKPVKGSKNLHNKNTHFAIHKATNSIAYSWDYNGYDPKELNEFKDDYFWVDVDETHEGNVDKFKKSDFVIIEKKNLSKKGIDLNDYLVFQGQKYANGGAIKFKAASMFSKIKTKSKAAAKKGKQKVDTAIKERKRKTTAAVLKELKSRKSDELGDEQSQGKRFDNEKQKDIEKLADAQGMVEYEYGDGGRLDPQQKKAVRSIVFAMDDPEDDWSYIDDAIKQKFRGDSYAPAVSYAKSMFGNGGMIWDKSKNSVLEKLPKSLTIEGKKYTLDGQGFSPKSSAEKMLKSLQKNDTENVYEIVPYQGTHFVRFAFFIRKKS